MTQLIIESLSACTSICVMTITNIGLVLTHQLQKKTFCGYSKNQNQLYCQGPSLQNTSHSVYIVSGWVPSSASPKSLGQLYSAPECTNIQRFLICLLKKLDSMQSCVWKDSSIFLNSHWWFRLCCTMKTKTLYNSSTRLTIRSRN